MFILMENLLPAEITLYIFSRLPVESVFRCRLVCKTWCTLLRRSDFAHMHIQHHINDSTAAKFGFLLLIDINNNQSNHSNGKYQLCYHEYDENDGRSYKEPLTRINHLPIEPYHFEVNSCNGLIYFFLSHPKNNPIYICNPINREYVTLPSFYAKMGGYPNGHMVCGFGYLPSTNEYKVVRICFRYDRDIDRSSGWYKPDEVYAQVYTLGSGSGWRKIKCSSLLPESRLLAPWGVLANGALYWLGNDGKSLSFDLANEELHYIQSPTYAPGDYNSYFQVWEGQLRFVQRKEFGGIHIWSFKKNNMSSTTTNDIIEQKYQSCSWSKEFTIALKPFFKPFALTKGGEVLMLDESHQKTICCYDPKTATIRKVNMDFKLSRAIPHVHSFVSLRALGEDAKIIKVKPAKRLPTEVEKLQPERWAFCRNRRRRN